MHTFQFGASKPLRNHLPWLATHHLQGQNRGMYVTPELITTIVSVFSAVALFLSGMFALLRRLEQRIDQRFDLVDKRFEQIDKLFEQIDKRFELTDRRAESLEMRINEKFAAVHEEIAALRSEVRTVAADVVDLKVAVARIEGSRPTLLQAR